ncbi:MAG: hypothetical protein ACE5HE_04450, partial [Phycisphaerae bacterium]
MNTVHRIRQFDWELGLILMIASGAGCAPTRFCAGVSYAAVRFRSRDASALGVRGYPHLRFDVRLRSELEDVIGLAELEDMKREGARVLIAAQTLAVETVNGELDRMSPDGISFLFDRYCGGGRCTGVDDQRKVFKERFSAESKALVDADLTALRAAGNLHALRRILTRISRRIEATVGDRGKLGRALLAAPLFLPATIGAEISDARATKRVIDASFEHVFVYAPAQAQEVRTTEQLASASDEQLALWFAPVYVQQSDPEAPYPPSEDQFGRVHLAGTPESVEVLIDIEHPTVYWTSQEARIGGTTRAQFVYVTWYPSRPALKPGDSEAGAIDGVVIRVTLDCHHRPAVYEFVRSCGCYHMLYVAEFLEAAARHHYGEPLRGRKYAIQSAGRGRELFIPALVPDDGSRPTRPVAYVSAGQHMLMGIERSAGGITGTRVLATRTYTLERYETLTRLPLGDRVASMFGSDGLVHNAGRPEGCASDLLLERHLDGE